MRKNKLLLLILLFGLLGMAGTPKPNLVRFISPWTLAMGGETVQLTHALGSRPLIVDVWAAHYVASAQNASCQADFTEVYESPDLHLSLVNPTVIRIENLSDAPICLQVVAEP